MKLLLEIENATFTQVLESCQVGEWNSFKRQYSMVIVSAVLTLYFKDGNKMSIRSETMKDGRRVVSSFSTKQQDKAFSELCDMMHGYFSKVSDDVIGLPVGVESVLEK